MSRSAETTAATLRYVDECAALMDEAISAEAYRAAAEHAQDVADLLSALNDRLVRERVESAVPHGYNSA